MITAFFTVYRNPEMSREEFVRYWIDVHTPIAAKLPHVKSYTVMPVITAAEIIGEQCDGFAILTFDSEDDFQAMLASPEMVESNADSAKFTRHFELYTVETHKII